jgi:hypothetical protein
VNRRKGPDYVEKSCGMLTSCWIWLGATNNKGYGLMTVGGETRLAHVVYYERMFGLVPEGKELDHLCATPLCIRPEHQEPVTHLENVHRGRKCKLTMELARAIRAEYFAPGKKFGRQSQLARKYGVTSPNIRSVVFGETWKEVA